MKKATFIILCTPYSDRIFCQNSGGNTANVVYFIHKVSWRGGVPDSTGSVMGWVAYRRPGFDKTGKKITDNNSYELAAA
jgi:hypothetical protein